MTSTEPLARILVIDDDEVFGDLTRQRLEIAGYEVVFQHGGFGGNMRAVRGGAFDVVVLDVNMPGLSGTSVLDLIHMNASAARASVLLYSSMDEEALRAVAERHRADDYICK